MKKTSVMLDETTRVNIKSYCQENGCQMSDAIRSLIGLGIESFEAKKKYNLKETFGPGSLLRNEKVSIRASIESTLLLRQLAKCLLKDADILKAVDDETSKIISKGWRYDDSLSEGS